MWVRPSLSYRVDVENIKLRAFYSPALVVAHYQLHASAALASIHKDRGWADPNDSGEKIPTRHRTPDILPLSQEEGAHRFTASVAGQFTLLIYLQQAYPAKEQSTIRAGN